MDIVIKPADKGGALVVWDRNLYVKEATQQLSNAQNYENTVPNTYISNQSVLRKNVNDFISLKSLPPTAHLHIKTHLRQSIFYLLPRIHKINNPGRPIIYVCPCPPEGISTYLDFILHLLSTVYHLCQRHYSGSSYLTTNQY